MSPINQPSSSSEKKRIEVSNKQLGGIADMLVNTLRTRYKAVAKPAYAENLSVDDLTFVLETKVDPVSNVEHISIDVNDGKGPIAFGLDLETGELGSSLQLSPEQLQTVKNILGR